MNITTVQPTLHRETIKAFFTLTRAKFLLVYLAISLLAFKRLGTKYLSLRAFACSGICGSLNGIIENRSTVVIHHVCFNPYLKRSNIKHPKIHLLRVRVKDCLFDFHRKEVHLVCNIANTFMCNPQIVIIKAE